MHVSIDNIIPTNGGGVLSGIVPVSFSLQKFALNVFIVWTFVHDGKKLSLNKECIYRLLNLLKFSFLRLVSIKNQTDLLTIDVGELKLILLLLIYLQNDLQL